MESARGRQTGVYIAIGIGVLAFVGVLASSAVYGIIRYQELQERYQALLVDWTDVRSKLVTSEALLVDTQVENTHLQELLNIEQEKMSALEREVRTALDAFADITGTVSVLERLSHLDPELLHKYSRVYFLNEHYVPSALATIERRHGYEDSRTYQFHADALPFLTRLIDAAHNEGIELRVISAYRSFDEQEAIKTGNVMLYGAGTANQFSADQGFSEHQLGTAVDFTTPQTGGAFRQFASTDAYIWLVENAHRYGFILSYPEENVYYEFEPWHWRFVGTRLATKLHEEGMHFYDMPQREIDTYLIDIFD